MRISLSQLFGDQVRSLRHARKLTQETLAAKSDLSIDAIRRIERGAFSPSLNTLQKLAAGLGVSLKTLFAAFEREGREDVAELADYLSTRSTREVRIAWRVIHAMFEEE